MTIQRDATADIAAGAGSMRLHLFRPAVEGRFPGILFFSSTDQKTAPSRSQPSSVTDLDAIEAGWRARGLTLPFNR